MLLKVCDDPLDVPTTAEIMPDDHVKGVAAVDTFWGTGADDLLDLIDGVVVAAAIEVDAGRLGLSCCRLAALAPDHCPIQHRIDIGELADRKSTRLNSSHLGISYAVFCL